MESNQDDRPAKAASSSKSHGGGKNKKAQADADETFELEQVLVYFCQITIDSISLRHVFCVARIKQVHQQLQQQFMPASLLFRMQRPCQAQPQLLPPSLVVRSCFLQVYKSVCVCLEVLFCRQVSNAIKHYLFLKDRARLQPVLKWAEENAEECAQGQRGFHAMVEVAVKHAKLVVMPDEGKLLQQQLQLRSTARDTALQKGRGRKGKARARAQAASQRMSLWSWN